MKHHSGKLRIIGGKYKGRQIRFTAAEGLRPTAERIRETLFNWLQIHIETSNCLDLFAGSGALGFEALSRGAKKVVFVESNRKAASMIKQTLAQLSSINDAVINQEATSYLTKCEQKFEIVFLDPPYKSELLQKSIDALHLHSLIKINGWAYIEYAEHSDPPEVPDTWELYRSTKAGDAKACLYRVSD